MGAKPKNKCLHCDLPPTCKNLCRRHYKKYLALKNGTYKKDYERRKKDPVFMEKKRLLDKIYRENKKLGIDTARKKNDNALVNQDWKKYSKQWRARTEYRKTQAVYVTNKYHEYRLKIIDHYTNGKNCCEHCGVTDERVLTIDHVNDDGAEHRRKIGQMTPVWWIIKNNYPPGFQILCFNCNWLKELDKRGVEFIKRNSIN